MNAALVQQVQLSRQTLHALKLKTYAVRQKLNRAHSSVRYLARKKQAPIPDNPLPETQYRDPTQCDRYDVNVPGLTSTPPNTHALQSLTEHDAKSLTVSHAHKVMHLAGQKIHLRLTRQSDALVWYAVCPHCDEVTPTLTCHPTQHVWRCPSCVPQALYERLAQKALGPIAAAARDLPRHPNPYVQARALSAHLQAVRKQALIVASDVGRVQQALASLETRVQEKLRQQIQDEIDFERVTYHRHAWSRAEQGASDVPVGMRRYFDAKARQPDTKTGENVWPTQKDLLSRQRTYGS